MADAALLDTARRLAAELLAPNAQEVDQSDTPPAENIRALAEAGLLGLTVPTEYGGAGASGDTVREFMAVVAGACGVTAFVLFQHLGVCRHVAGGENEPLKAELLPELAAGRRFATLAFSHLRRPGPPAVRVEETAEGLRFNGAAPWATGWGLADELLLAGTLPDGRFAWAVTPAVESEQLQASVPLRLCAGTASATVSLTFRDLVIPTARFVKTSTREQLDADTLGGMLSHSMLSLGVARTATALVRGHADSGRHPFLADAAARLAAESAHAEQGIRHWVGRPGEAAYRENVLRLRATCIELGVRATHMAVIAAGGAANLVDHPAQRLYREALLYSVTASTPELVRALSSMTTREGEDR